MGICYTSQDTDAECNQIIDKGYNYVVYISNLCVYLKLNEIFRFIFFFQLLHVIQREGVVHLSLLLQGKIIFSINFNLN